MLEFPQVLPGGTPRLRASREHHRLSADRKREDVHRRDAHQGADVGMRPSQGFAQGRRQEGFLPGQHDAVGATAGQLEAGGDTPKGLAQAPPSFTS